MSWVWGWAIPTRRRERFPGRLSDKVGRVVAELGVLAKGEEG